MKKIIIFTLLLFSLGTYAQNSPKTSNDLKQFWKNFQTDVKSGDKEKVANHFKFPFMNIFKYFEGEESKLDREKFLQYYDDFFTNCVKQAIAHKTFNDLTIKDNVFYFTIHYPPPTDAPAGGGAAMFIFKQQADKTYKITLISCAGGCEDDNCE